MRDTIELLEAVGRDASLRHAAAQDLAGILAQAGAAPCLTTAIAAGDRAILAEEFGSRSMMPTQATQIVFWEEEA